MNKTRKELPYWPLGPFKVRLPIVHYHLEKVEFIQGLILGATAMSALVYLTDYLGVSSEVAYSMILFDVGLYLLHGLLGDPVVPGWITASLPLTLVYLGGFAEGPERIQAMIALQLMVAFVFFFMGITGLAKRFVTIVPNSIKAAILLAAPVSVIAGQLDPNGGMHKYPIALIAGFSSLVVISYSKIYQRLRGKFYIFDLIGKYGNLFPYMIAMIIGIIVGELAPPNIQLYPFIQFIDFKLLLNSVSIFGVGVPPLAFFVQAVPLALVSYIIAFGDFVTTTTLVESTKEVRDDEINDFNENRSNFIIGIRNLFQAIFSPFPPLAGPLWAGMTVSTIQRYKEGPDAMKSLLGGMASFRIGTFFCVMLIPITSFMAPVFAVGGAITLMFQGIVSGQIGASYMKTKYDQLIAPFTAVIIAFMGSAWGLFIGLLLCMILGDFDYSVLRRK